MDISIQVQRHRSVEIFQRWIKDAPSIIGVASGYAKIASEKWSIYIIVESTEFIII